MSIESVSFINDLVITNPPGTDLRSEGDDHIRNMKIALKATFPGLAGRIWRTQAKAANYTVVVADNITLLSCIATITLALTAAATLGNGFMFLVHANGANVTIDPNASETINGAPSLVIPSGSSSLVFCDGAGFFAFSLTTSVFTNPGYTDQVLIDQAAVDWNMNLGGIATWTLAGNRTMNAPTNLKKGVYILHLYQDGVGSRLVTWNALFKWPFAIAPVLSTGVGKHDIISFICDGADLFGSYMLDVR